MVLPPDNIMIKSPPVIAANIIYFMRCDIRKLSKKYINYSLSYEDAVIASFEYGYLSATSVDKLVELQSTWVSEKKGFFWHLFDWFKTILLFSSSGNLIDTSILIGLSYVNVGPDLAPLEHYDCGSK